MREITNAPLSPSMGASSRIASAPSWFDRASAVMTSRTVLVRALALGVGAISLTGIYQAIGPAGTSVLALAGGPVDLLGQPIEQLRAAPLVDSGSDSGADYDYDGDGLSDAQELVLGLMPFSADTDSDGYDDGEEIARQSDPFDEFSIPTSDGISASVTARGGETENLRLVIVIHEPAGQIGHAKLRFGALTPRSAVSVPIERFMAIADVLTSVGTDGSRVTTVDIPIQSGFVRASEHVTFFMAAGSQSQASFSAGAKIDVLSQDGILMLLRPSASSGASLQRGRSIRQPIPPREGPGIPDTWVRGAICVQSATTVGGSGAVVLKQIIEAECVQGFDSQCSSGCAGSVGTTYRTIDPAVFIGG